MTDVEKLHLIESYHNGTLTAEEQVLVDNLCKQEPEFAQELQDYDFLLEGFDGLELEAFEAQMQCWEQNSKQKAAETPVIALPQTQTQTQSTEKKTLSIFSSRRSLFAAAAAVLLLLSALPLYNYFSNSSEQLMAEILDSTTVPSRVRGTDTLVLAQAEQLAKDLKEKAFTAYNAGDYASAIKSLNEYLDKNKAEDDVLFFLGTAKLYQNDAEGASRDFEQVMNFHNGKSNYAAEAEWLMAVAQWRLGNKDACIRLLNNILQNPMHDYKDKAKKLMNELK